MKSVRPAIGLALLASAICGLCPPAAAQGTRAIYRCHAANGDLVFQDKPCSASPGTLEARNNHEGEIIQQVEAPPAESGTPAVERYTRYLDLLSKERREQQAADEAQANLVNARLEAEARADRTQTQQGYGSDDRSVDGCPGSGCYDSGYAVPYAYFPQSRHRGIGANGKYDYNGPYRNDRGSTAPGAAVSTTTAGASGTPNRPVGTPFQRNPARPPPKDPRSEILRTE